MEPQISKFNFAMGKITNLIEFRHEISMNKDYINAKFIKADVMPLKKSILLHIDQWIEGYCEQIVQILENKFEIVDFRFSEYEEKLASNPELIEDLKSVLIIIDEVLLCFKNVYRFQKVRVHYYGPPHKPV